MPTRATELGWRGEGVAERWLEQRSFVFIERNFRTRYGEIDLVMREGQTLVFVEVKVRQNRRFGAPEESVGESKLRKIAMAVEEYRRRKNETGPCRIDLLVLEYSNTQRKWLARHIPNI